ncbi:plant UBX domain-containing protein 2 isoform X2 [Phoenix dactylifera]|uniref:Plant UBX domain-containing protein 2 isoform X2 n=1 Tax=Phoenix dactylifera TaxID=42345 RepID=A0A8B7CPH2_PHODC|nr:plant UBX domain-containing protein 2 isoform X2 [Phoenix dactylifera]
MEDVKDKMKGLMKKVNKPFSSSPSSKFKGQGRVLGSSSDSDSAAASSPSSSAASAAASRLLPIRPPPTSRSLPKPSPKSVPKPSEPNPSTEFNPFDPLVSSGRHLVNGFTQSSVNSFECPVCARSFPSEADVAAHIDACLTQDAATAPLGNGVVAEHVSTFLSAVSADGAVEVVLKLLRNVVREPENEKFRRIRMGNPKIKEAVGEVKGGVELLECLGFELGEEGGEVWATMHVPSEEQLAVVRDAVSFLESWKSEDSNPTSAETLGTVVESSDRQKKIDRQVRVFFPVPENVAARIDLPDSFYNLSSQELKREAELRKKKISESQLLIPKSYREKQAVTARKKYKRTVIRIQFPDGVVLQGVFLPWEPTTALYEEGRLGQQALKALVKADSSCAFD